MEDKFNWGLLEPHNLLGFKNQNNIQKLIKGKEITTLKNGLRGGFQNKNATTKILTVGDSFAFGYEVSDKETWQSCLNKNIKNKDFLNGGVGGYGTGQAILNAKMMKSNIYTNLLVQTLVGNDFYRDTLSSFNGFPKPYFAKLTNKKIVIVPPTTREQIKKTYFENQSPSIFDHLVVNYTILKRFNKETFFYKLWEKSYSKFDPMASIKGEKHASKFDIIKWSLNESKKIDPNVVWLLQYAQTHNFFHEKERQQIIKLLEAANIRYIDTFDYVHGNYASDISKNKIWFGHHTPLGNNIVCRAILDSKIYN